MSFSPEAWKTTRAHLRHPGSSSTDFPLLRTCATSLSFGERICVCPLSAGYPCRGQGEHSVVFRWCFLGGQRLARARCVVVVAAIVVGEAIRCSRLWPLSE
eukprot:scaffold88175_cov26-Tisochrysis_lutea.AAC.2